ncbi:MAG: M13-type metalloendopeptidase [bacterium]
MTLGEHSASFGGVVSGYDALQRALARSGRPGLIDGYAPEQRYFLGYVQSWRSHDRPERLRARVTVDPHVPARWRTNGPLSKSDAFAKAFDSSPATRWSAPPG